jgi:hypothetical protein
MDAKTIEAVAADSGLSPKSVQKVVDSLEAVVIDPAPGTVLRDPATGDVATRVRQYAETYWRVRSVDDRTWTVFEPIVGWDVLYDAPAVVTTPGDAAVDPVEPVAPATTEGEVL